MKVIFSIFMSSGVEGAYGSSKFFNHKEYMRGFSFFTEEDGEFLFFSRTEKFMNSMQVGN